MTRKYFSWMFFAIIGIISITIAIQYYWNEKNYRINQQQFASDIQTILDNSVEVYFSEIIKKEKTQTPIYNEKLTKDSNSKKIQFNSEFIDGLLKKNKINKSDSISISITDFGGASKDSNNRISFQTEGQSNDLNSSKNTFLDSIRLRNGISSIYFSVINNRLELSRISYLMEDEFSEKKIKIDFGLKHFRDHKLIDQIGNLIEDSLSFYAKKTYLKKNENIELIIPNQPLLILKEGQFGILISAILSLIIILTLLYFLKIINRLKRIDAIKDDFVSNITHEFKTPITIVYSALELAEKFDENNIILGKDYLEISLLQLTKLDSMVERVLETAYLDVNDIVIEKMKVNLIDLLKRCIDKVSFLKKDKNIFLSSDIEDYLIKADIFHLENAISNIIENSIKYGGINIEIAVLSKTDFIEILISDDGMPINNIYKEKIFEKFYRIENGNLHNPKGHGIGLFYARKIISKHNGEITLSPDKNRTTFKIIFKK